MERAILSSEIAKVDLRGAVTHGVGAQGIEVSETVRRMEESIPQVTVLLEAAVERCITITGGSEADELILALDDIMLQYISFLQETLKSLRAVLFGSSLDQNQSHITAHDGNKEPYLGGRAALDVAAVRLVDAPEKARKLFNLLEQAHDLQLEPLAEGISNSDVNNDEAQFFATEWMFKVAEGATALYMEQLRGIQQKTDRGAQQLSVDIDT
ncbi:hypothetical protein GH714_026333 [Hevea brasiliensis]|uniref:Conserved oligomeric Golgi complex subunit 7 n=1 Tax=Hevea brasiliensis TaxID=3981 RepID=A0A6A6MEM8_HEVBR|nr:hypothetical protein GH714_026333 [Hevea brasiliensis]